MQRWLFFAGCDIFLLEYRVLCVSLANGFGHQRVWRNRHFACLTHNQPVLLASGKWRIKEPVLSFYGCPWGSYDVQESLSSCRIVLFLESDRSTC